MDSFTNFLNSDFDDPLEFHGFRIDQVEYNQKFEERWNNEESRNEMKYEGLGIKLVHLSHNFTLRIESAEALLFT